MKSVANDTKARPSCLIAALMTMTIAGASSCAARPDTDASAGTRPADSLHAQSLLRGEDLFKESCSACHGVDARGNGPVAPILKVPVPDLTLIASRRGGAFPADEIYRIVDGQADLGAHGPRSMPVWGYEFFGEDADDESAHGEATEKIESLLEFLRSIQRTG